MSGRWNRGRRLEVGEAVVMVYVTEPTGAGMLVCLGGLVSTQPTRASQGWIVEVGASPARLRRV